jgi:RNA polymerase sigma-70 factor (ECF subfamily)
MLRFFDITLDDCVLERARAGDRAAHEQLYAAFAGAVYSLIRRLVVRPAVAEELAQDVFVEILRGIGDYQGSGSFAGSRVAAGGSRISASTLTRAARMSPSVS